MIILKQKSHEVIQLTNKERNRIKKAVSGIQYPMPHKEGYGRYIMQAETAVRSVLSEELLSQLYMMRGSRYKAGTLLFRNMPVDDNLPSTPADNKAENAFEGASIARTALVGFASILGFPIGHEEEQGGHLVHNVIPVLGTDKPLSNEGNTDFGFHVENAIFENREKFVLLYGLRADLLHQAVTPVADVRLALRYLDVEDIAELSKKQFVIRKPYILDRSNTKSYSEPVSILSGPLDNPELRATFYADGTKSLNKKAELAFEKLKKAMNEVVIDLKLGAGDMVIINNRAVMHGRKSFAVSGNGEDRWLIRVYVIGDLNSITSAQENSDYILRRENSK